ncbi:PH domain-containing protein [Paenibacillus sp. IB182496]|uniref:PH domain-containing protein n=1 Tax=Paenibacillus sabuli TaxID=2772509 RepID=A0A927GU37_9BACL|nr:PH domain-containing protein [Paenibacillus sabuli]MBD2847951.1 PH domain-containing protein [Paenibacillus sabuli]
MDKPSQKIDPGALKAWRVSGMLSAVCYSIAVAVLIWLTVRLDWPIWVWITAVLLAGAGATLEIAVLPAVKYRQWRYAVDDEQIELRHGIIVLKRTTIPMVRVQHVDTKQGPILKRYGLATVTFSTAAGSHEIPALTERTADEIRSRIARLAILSEEEL